MESGRFESDRRFTQLFSSILDHGANDGDESSWSTYAHFSVFDPIGSTLEQEIDMNRIDDSNRPNACVCSGPSNTPSATASGNSTFRKILDTVSVVASAAIPGLPIIGAISNVFKKHTDLDPGRFTGSSEALQYLELQRAIEIETRAFETASNVLKARHDAHMNSIRNLRS